MGITDSIAPNSFFQKNFCENRKPEISGQMGSFGQRCALGCDIIGGSSKPFFGRHEFNRSEPGFGTTPIIQPRQSLSVNELFRLTVINRSNGLLDPIQNAKER